MTTRQGAAERRAAAAQTRREAATAVRHERGDIAYRAFRSSVPGTGRSRQVATAQQVRGLIEPRNGKNLYHTSGFFTRYGTPYPMWDQFGEYDEVVARGAGARTIANKPDVAFLVNHKGVTMARTVNQTLLLEERPEGGWHDAWLNPARGDVHDLTVAIDDGSVDQMSFAFMVDEGSWTEDFERFTILAYDLDRGDVSAVNYGASPSTNIAGMAGEVLDNLEHLPTGALVEAQLRIGRKLGTSEPTRDRIEVRSETRRRKPVEPSARAGTDTQSPYVRRLTGRRDRTAARLVDFALRNNLDVADLTGVALPWYEIHNAAGDGAIEDDRVEPGVATVFIYDEIGGSFGVDAKTFAADLMDITAPEIKLRINSPGGSVFEGLAIHSSLLHHPSRITAYVDGIAASAASVIAMAGDEVVIMPGGEFMVHDASMVMDGNPADMGKAQTYLERQSDHLATLYARKTGDAAEWRDLMRAETWAFPEEAIDLGLADRIGGRAEQAAIESVGGEVAERMLRTHDLSQWGYRYMGRRTAPEPLRQTARAADQPTRTERSSADGPKGRSLALVIAEARAGGIDVE